MNYVMYYDFDNFDSIYECIPSVRNGVAFGMFDCIVKFYTMNDNQVTFWINGSSKLVKLRNKIAHGDTVDEQNLTNCLGQCEYLAMQMFSKQFFRRRYEELHITSYRYFDKEDPYK